MASQTTLTENLLLSSTAAVLSKTAASPIERVKLLLQCQREMLKTGALETPYTGAVNCIRRTWQNEGALSFFRGNLPSCLRYFPVQAMNFALKNQIQTLFKSNRNDGYRLFFAKNVMSGSTAGVLALFIVYPLDFSRTKLGNDIKNTPKASYKHPGMISVCKNTFNAEGFRGLYRGLWISCAGVMVYRGAYFGLYDTIKPVVLDINTHVYFSFLIGYLTSVTASLMYYPFDTLRRRMMMTSCEKEQYKGAIDCARSIIRNEGYFAIMRGAGVNIVRGMTGAVVLLGFDILQELYKEQRDNSTV